MDGLIAHGEEKTSGTVSAVACLVRVLVNPCFAHPETEVFSFFIAFEGLLTMKSKTCSAAVTPADINCRLPQSLVLLPGAGNRDEIPFVEQHSHRGPPLLGLDIGDARLA